MTGAPPVWITEAEVVELTDLVRAMDAVEQGFVAEGEARAATMVKTQVSWQEDGPAHSLHAVGGVLTAAGLVGTKTWAHTHGGANPLLLLFGAEDGQLRAVVEAFALGQLRTAAVSGIATRRLATPDADVLAICGTGSQALPQVAAVAAARQLRHVRVFGRDPERRRLFAERVRSELGIAAEGLSSAADAVRGAPVVTLATRATAPFLAAEMVERGTHVNAVGAITPDRAEFEPALLDRCAIVATDSVPGARSHSRELQERYGVDGRGWAGLTPLARLAADDMRRPPGADVTLLKTMGVGLADVALGAQVLEEARRGGRGRPLEPTRRVPPRLRLDTVGGNA
ncbi:MAG: ornithine cyclodeaminase family protein [Candidatus Dormibacteraeota bacterium]|nr:ornithine cyclodeaminase family protein [Candidatus Dormibacteraeota bacterium]MBO0760313.1 ornithine cyclodeaminase family protein [Candidatus Dormibacteraeota bacterium]